MCLQSVMYDQFRGYEKSMDNKVIPSLLYEVSLAYEKRIIGLEAENARLKYLLNDSSLFKIEQNIKNGIYRVAEKVSCILKDVVIILGLKDYVKRTKLYHIYDKKRGGQ